tara:strand:+ start:74 stop:601 length:528 start_codon:yes stop_codon:yes gene_type:complete
MSTPKSPKNGRAGRRATYLLGVMVLSLALLQSACSLRTYPPIKYLPLLGKEKEVSTTAVLSRALNDRDVSVRAQAIEILGMLSQSDKNDTVKEAARQLGRALKDPDPGIRLQAVEVLGGVDGKYSNKYLLSGLKDPNPFIRIKVIEELNARELSISQERLRAAKEAAAATAAAAQ